VYAPAEWADTHPISTLSLYGVFSFVNPLRTDSNYQYLIYGNPVRKLKELLSFEKINDYFNS
jgi:hypothetical protein